MVTRYKHAVLALSAALMVAAGVGCDGGDANRGTTPPPGTPAAVDPPTTLPAPAGDATSAAKPVPAGQAASSYLWIKEVPDPRKSQGEFVPSMVQVDETWTAVQFPRARLRLASKGEDKLVGLLYSDDPKEAISKDWQGDRYYFRMPLPHVPDAKALDGAPFRMSVPLDGVGADETTNGVFLKGDRYHLEPVDLSATFEVHGPLVHVRMGGRFKCFDTTDVEAEPRWFHLQGILQAAVD